MKITKNTLIKLIEQIIDRRLMESDKQRENPIEIVRAYEFAENTSRLTDNEIINAFTKGDGSEGTYITDDMVFYSKDGKKYFTWDLKNKTVVFKNREYNLNDTF